MHFLHNNLQTKAPIRPLRVGYLSNDWRDHPMGRLTSNLVTAHSISKRLSSQSDDFTAIDDKLINDNNSTVFHYRNMNKITTYRNIMNCRVHHHHHYHHYHVSNNHHDDHNCYLYDDRIYASALSYGSNDFSEIRAKVMYDSFEFIDYSTLSNDMDVADDIHTKSYDIIIDITGTIHSIIL